MALNYPYDFISAEVPPDLADALAVDPSLDPYAPDPADYAVDPYIPQAYPGGRFLESFSGLEGTPLPPAHSFGEGLLYGLTRGLGAQGTQALQRRAKFESDQARRQAAVDQERIHASQEYRRDLTAGKRASGQERRTNEAARIKYEQETVPMPPDAPSWVKRLADDKGRVDRKTLADALNPEKGESLAETKRHNQAMENIDRTKANKTENGKPPTASERDQLSTDLGMLDQLNSVRQAYKPEFVGPVSGKFGGVAQRTPLIGGAMSALTHRPGGEATFRSRLAGVRNIILRARSGGAVTPTEADRLLEELPTTNDRSDVFEAKLDQFEHTFRTLAQNRRDVMSNTGVDLTRLKPLPPVAGETAPGEYQPGGFFDSNRPKGKK